MSEPIGCHVFQSQSVVSCGSEPVAIWLSETKLFVATISRTVEVHDLSSENREHHWFYTESLVSTIVYNQSGNFVATLEVKETRNKAFQFVKVYLNWQVDEPKRPTKARMSGDAGALNLPDLDGDQIELINISYHGNLTAIATCTKNSNIAIATDSTVTIFRLVEQSLPKSGRLYKDMKPLAEITFDFDIMSTCLCEDYLAICGLSQAIVVRLSYSNSYHHRQRRHSSSYVRETTDKMPALIRKDVDYDSNKRTSSRPDTVPKYSATTITLPIPPQKSTPSVNESTLEFQTDPLPRFTTFKSLCSKYKTATSAEPVSSSVDCVVWDFNSSGDDDIDSSSSAIFTKSVTAKKIREVEKVPKSICFPGLSVEKQGGLLGTAAVNVKVKNHAEEMIGAAVAADVIMNASLDTGCIGHLQLVPTYSRASTFEAPKHSSEDDRLVGISCYIGGEEAGFMYSLSHTAARLLSTYKFKNRVLQVCCQGAAMHVVTDHGLETYTSRCTAIPASKLEQVDFVTKVFPSPDIEPMFLCGQPFVDIVQAAASSQHVVLLSKVTPNAADDIDGNIWSLYSLRNSEPYDLYQELASIACQTQKVFPERCVHLLQEAFMLLKSHEINTPELDLADLLCESAALLGEFYARPSCEEDYKLALPYLVMSQMSLDDIVTQTTQHSIVSENRQICRYGKGLMHFLQNTIFDSTRDFSQTKQSTCEKILEIYSDMDSEKLPSVILFSFVTNYRPDFALDMINQCDMTGSGKTIQSHFWLAKALLQLHCCEPELAENALANVNTEILLKTCIHHPSLIHVELAQLSPLAQLLRQHFPDIFIEAMVALLWNGSVAMDTAIKMISGDATTDRLYEHSHVQLYLEAILSDDEFEEAFEDAALLLTEIYLAKLIHPDQVSARTLNTGVFHLPQDCGHFSSRYSWLDAIPPLNGSVSYKPCSRIQLPSSHLGHHPRSITPVKVKAQTDHPCVCCWCNESLVKLQSLMCSHHTKNSLRDRVDQFMGDNSSLTGIESLMILSLLPDNTATAAQLIVDRIPDILPDFVSSCFDTRDLLQWRRLMDILSGSIAERVQQPQSSQEGFLRVYRGVLSVMAKSFTPPTFIGLLPADGNLDFFSPYIQQCCHSNEMKMHKWDIMQRGATLKSSR